MEQENYCRHALGRLIEIRVTIGYRTRADVDAMTAAIVRETAKVPASERLVFATDWRSCPVLSEDAAQYLLQTVRITNPRVERSALLSSGESSVTKLQLARLIREANANERRAFSNPNELATWLAPVLNASELLHLRAFLEDAPPGRAQRA